MASANVVVLSGANFDSEVKASEVPVLVDFWADGCGPCRMLEPILDQLADENIGTLKVGKVHVNSNMDLGAQFNVRTFPTMLFFKDGQLAGTINGLKSKDALLKKAQSL